MIFLDGWIVSCGLLLVVAGAGKAYSLAARRGGDSAIRRALRIGQRRWRVIESSTAAVECGVGVLTCAGIASEATGVAIAGLGTVFTVLLGWVMFRRVPGGCGCTGWTTGTAVSGRHIGRAALLAGSGLVEVMAPERVLSSVFWAGVAAGSVVWVALSIDALPRTPVCRRPLWRPLASTIAALTRTGVFQAMAAASGPFAAAVYRRDGCVDEFWFTPAGAPGRLVVFRFDHDTFAVKAIAREMTPPADARPIRLQPG